MNSATKKRIELIAYEFGQMSAFIIHHGEERFDLAFHRLVEH
jgi:hypothetical protein